MLIGNIAALRQTNVKRMLAFSSVGQAGYLLIAVVAHTPLATRALLYYLTVYAAMNLGALAVVSVREREIGGPVSIGDLRGLATFPSFHVCLAILTAWALAPVPVLGPLAILLNAAVIVATIGWEVLQVIGGWYISHEVKNASAVYGTFALVIGLLAWIHLGSMFVVLGAETNVVRTRRLWPRSLFGGPGAGTPEEGKTST